GAQRESLLIFTLVLPVPWCINRRLYHIASVRAVVSTPAEKRRAVLIDSLIFGLFPLLCYPNL
ncbi:hypothetical protein C8R44DRAFT_824493, partial [Mycena epipterygia]